MDKVNRKERTLVIIKPDGIQRSLMGEIIQRMERVGLKLVAIKMVSAEKERVEKHYTVDPNWLKNVGEKTLGENASDDEKIKKGKELLALLTKFMTACPVVVMVWQGAHSAKLVRKLVGRTEPLTSEAGTIRGDYVLDSYAMSDADGRAVRNVIHASENEDFAKREIDVWFEPNEINDYRIITDEILYDVNLDGLKE